MTICSPPQPMSRIVDAFDSVEVANAASTSHEAPLVVGLLRYSLSQLRTNSDRISLDVHYEILMNR